jgi:hypothetical protein
MSVRMYKYSLVKIHNCIWLSHNRNNKSEVRVRAYEISRAAHQCIDLDPRNLSLPLYAHMYIGLYWEFGPDSVRKSDRPYVILLSSHRLTAAATLS